MSQIEQCILLRSHKKLEQTINLYKKPNKTMILYQEQISKITKKKFNRIYLIKDRDCFLNNYPINDNNFLFEYLHNNRMVKPYCFFSNITDIKTIEGLLSEYSAYLETYYTIDEYSPREWTLLQNSKDTLCILNNKYYFKNNKNQLDCIKTYCNNNEIFKKSIDLSIYNHGYKMTMINQSNIETPNDILKIKKGEYKIEDYCFIMRYNRLWDIEYYIEKRDIPKEGVKIKRLIKIRRKRNKNISITQ